MVLDGELYSDKFMHIDLMKYWAKGREFGAEAGKRKMKKTMVTKKEKPRYNKTHDCRCQTKTIATVFKNFSQEKKDIVEEMGFGALAHVPEMNVSHALLKELIDCYDEYRNHFPGKVEYGKLNEADKAKFDSLKYVTLATLTKSVLDMSVEGEENRQQFRRTFVVRSTSCCQQR
ncbi:hypothetical protein Ahy_A02g008713 [Arachis hypogaea]|uniref:Uncharacterized protein n=1 Tax=Arachis hypogaea TaxID=3818 RepID=A0A445EF04_ARAHY|nr:hypothetical protein Ahy_A02g008713 [Arachis hypogaea]